MLLSLLVHTAAEEAERKIKTKQLLFRLQNRAASTCYKLWKDFVHEAKIKVCVFVCVCACVYVCVCVCVCSGAAQLTRNVALSLAASRGHVCKFKIPDALVEAAHGGQVRRVEGCCLHRERSSR